MRINGHNLHGKRFVYEYGKYAMEAHAAVADEILGLLRQYDRCRLSAEETVKAITAAIEKS